jgi:hypothetical protein
MSSVTPEGVMGSVTTLGVRGKLAGNGCESVDLSSEEVTGLKGRKRILEADEGSIDLKYGP